ncbi:hypothetical protein GJ496_002151 [Pomphorhynchus laevis]|nr:hypothetical protein GJ496_002151 [Pomphorhynchus laevis]
MCPQTPWNLFRCVYIGWLNLFQNAGACYEDLGLCTVVSMSTPECCPCVALKLRSLNEEDRSCDVAGSFPEPKHLLWSDLCSRTCPFLFKHTDLRQNAHLNEIVSFL